MEKRFFLKTQEFWKLYSERYMRIKKNSELPKSLYIKFALDFLFGGLAKHKVIFNGSESIEILCSECKNVQKKSFVCDTHIGCMNGLIGNMEYRIRHVERSSSCKFFFLAGGKNE